MRIARVERHAMTRRSLPNPKTRKHTRYHKEAVKRGSRSPFYTWIPGKGDIIPLYAIKHMGCHKDPPLWGWTRAISRFSSWTSGREASWRSLVHPRSCVVKQDGCALDDQRPARSQTRIAALLPPRFWVIMVIICMFFITKQAAIHCHLRSGSGVGPPATAGCCSAPASYAIPAARGAPSQSRRGKRGRPRA